MNLVAVTVPDDMTAEFAQWLIDTYVEMRLKTDEIKLPEDERDDNESN